MQKYEKCAIYFFIDKSKNEQPLSGGGTKKTQTRTNKYQPFFVLKNMLHLLRFLNKSFFKGKTNKYT